MHMLLFFSSASGNDKKLAEIKTTKKLKFLSDNSSADNSDKLPL